MASGSGKPGNSRRTERLKAALRDNLKRRKAQIKGRAQPAATPESAGPRDSAGIGHEIASPRPKG